MKKILFVAAVISLLNACSESVYEYTDNATDEKGKINTPSVTPAEGSACQSEDPVCAPNGGRLICKDYKWKKESCNNLGCYNGKCNTTGEICKEGRTRSRCDTHNKNLLMYCADSFDWITNTIECAGRCIDTESLSNIAISAKCVACINVNDCCINSDNSNCIFDRCIKNECIPKDMQSCDGALSVECKDEQNYDLRCNGKIFATISCAAADTTKAFCDKDSASCVQCVEDSQCSVYNNASKNHCDTSSHSCVQCLSNEHCSQEKPICIDGECDNCPQDQRYDEDAQKCIEPSQCNPDQVLDPSGKCVDKCSLEGVKAYLQEHSEYGIDQDVLDDSNTCIISYDEDREQTVLSCDKLRDNIEDRDIIFCGTVYLDKFDGLINSIKGRKIFGVHDATITSHEYTQIHKPLFGVVTNSTIYNLKIRNIQFNDIGNDEQAIRGIIEKMEGTEDTPCEIENISIENVSIVSNANSSKPMGGLIGEANYLSAKGISVDNFRLNVTESQGNVGGLFGYANKVTFNKPTINGITINALKPAAQLYEPVTQSYEDVGGVIGQGHDITISGGDINNITIASDLNDVGGLIGDSNGVVINPNADETLNISVNSIFGYEDVGGLIGEANKLIEINNGSDDSVLNITTKYVKGFAHVGGVIGNSNNARLSLHHIRNSTSMIYGNCCAAGFIDYVKETDEANNEDTMDIVIDDIYNECDNTASECIYNAQRTAGFIGYFGVSAMASASITNIINYFPNATMSATDDAAGFIGYISIDTDNSNSLTINNIISNVGKVNGTDIVGGFIAFINFGDAGAEEPQLMISDVTSNAVVFASDEDVSENTQLYNIAMTYFAMGGYLANKLKMDDSYIQNKGAGFVNTIGNDWYTNTIESNDLTNRYMHKYNYCCTTPSSCIIGHASCGEDDRYYKWPPIFEMNFYENAFTSKLSISNIAVKHDTQSFDFVSKQKHNGYNTLSRYIEKINQRACAGSDKDGLMKSLDQINAFNSIYRKNIFIYSTVDHGLPSSPPGREKELYSVNHTYSYPLNDCDYADFNNNNANNIYIMYDKYCDVGESRECTKNNMSEIDALTDMTKENAYHVTEVPNLINSEGLQTWHFDKTLGLPVPALQGIVVKQAEPLSFESIEPIDPDDSREPAPDSPVEP